MAERLTYAIRETCLMMQGRAVIENLQALLDLSPLVSGGTVTTIDLQDVTHLDTAGAWALVQLQAGAQDRGREIELSNPRQAHRQLIEIVAQNVSSSTRQQQPVRAWSAYLADLGERVTSGGRTGLEMVSLLGQILACIATVTFRPRRLRLTSLVHHCQEAGTNAVPIVALMAFLIGVVLAFQGATQLRQFGAEVFVVDLIAISILRELGILLTAIIVAGRSGAAFTAAIGAMKMREEIDALRTLGLDPIAVLVVPRVLALMIMLPVLGFIADIAGLLGGALMSWVELGVTPAVFQARLVSSTEVTHFVVGMIKAPFFAIIIGVVGCYEGMIVRGNAESLGRLTSTAVVLAIFLVIVADALFSIFFAVVGI